MVTPRERRVTQQIVRRVASRMCFGAQARITLLRALQMTTGIQRGSRLVSVLVRQNRDSWGLARWVLYIVAPFLVQDEIETFGFLLLGDP